MFKENTKYYTLVDVINEAIAKYYLTIHLEIFKESKRRTAQNFH